MRRLIMLAVPALAAASMSIATAAPSASALPEFKGIPKDERVLSLALLFSELLSRPPIHHYIHCLHVERHRLILIPSMRTHLLILWLLCTLHRSTTTKNCSEPIVSKPLTETLGLVKKGSGPVGMLVRPESGTVIAEFHCEGTTTTYSGEFVEEIPEINKSGVNQYNKSLTKYEIVAAQSAAKGEQAVTTFELLESLLSEGMSEGKTFTPLFMEKVGLTSEGASVGVEVTEELTLPEALEIST